MGGWNGALGLGWAGDQRWRLEASVCTWPIADWAHAPQIGTNDGVFGGGLASRVFWLLLSRSMGRTWINGKTCLNRVFAFFCIDYFLTFW